MNSPSLQECYTAQLAAKAGFQGLLDNPDDDYYRQADVIDEVSIGNILGYQARMIDEEAVWETVLHKGIDFVSVDMAIGSAEPLDEASREDFEALFEEILDRAGDISH